MHAVQNGLTVAQSLGRSRRPREQGLADEKTSLCRKLGYPQRLGKCAGISSERTP